MLVEVAPEKKKQQQQQQVNIKLFSLYKNISHHNDSTNAYILSLDAVMSLRTRRILTHFLSNSSLSLSLPL